MGEARSARRAGVCYYCGLNRAGPARVSVMGEEAIVIRDPEVLGGTPVFAGTRVPVQTLWDYLCAGQGLDKFLDDFPTVTRRQAEAVMVEGSRGERS